MSLALLWAKEGGVRSDGGVGVLRALRDKSAAGEKIHEGGCGYNHGFKGTVFWCGVKESFSGLNILPHFVLMERYRIGAVADELIGGHAGDGWLALDSHLLAV